jgi:hypothetical protein
MATEVSNGLVGESGYEKVNDVAPRIQVSCAALVISVGPVRDKDAGGWSCRNNRQKGSDRGEPQQVSQGQTRNRSQSRDQTVSSS